MDYLNELPRSIRWKIHLGVLEVPPSLVSVDTAHQSSAQHSDASCEHAIHEQQHQSQRDRCLAEIQIHNQTLINTQRIRYETAVTHHFGLRRKKTRNSSNLGQSSQPILPYPPTVVVQHSPHDDADVIDLFSRLEIHRLSREAVFEDPLIISSAFTKEGDDYDDTCDWPIPRHLLSSVDLKHLDLIEKDVNRLPRSHHLCHYALKQRIPNRQTINVGNEEPSFSNWFQFMHNYLSHPIDYKQDLISQQSRIERNHILTEMLWIYATEHENMGYRQGFHEILSWIVLVLEIDVWEQHIPTSTQHEDGPRSTLEEIDESSLHQDKLADDPLLPYLFSSSSSRPACNQTEHNTPLSTPTSDPSISRKKDVHHECIDWKFLKHDAYNMFEALLLRLAPAYDVLDPSNEDTSPHSFLSPTSYSNLLSETDDYLMNKVISLGRNMVFEDDEKEETSSQTSQHQMIMSMTSIGTSILNHIRFVAGDEDLYWFLKELSVPAELYCTRWIRLLLSREVIGWENVLQLWDFLFELSSIGFSRNLVGNKLHFGLMEVLECAAASMLLLEREPLLRQAPPTPNGSCNRHDSSDKIDLLVNYPPLQKTLPLLTDYVTFMTHQLHVMRKHEGSNLSSPPDFFFVHSPQRSRPSIAPPSMTNSVTKFNKDFFINRYNTRYNQWLKPRWSNAKVYKETDESNQRTTDDIELISNEYETDSSPFRVLQKSKLLKSAWNEASRRMMSKVDSLVDSPSERTPERKKSAHDGKINSS